MAFSSIGVHRRGRVWGQLRRQYRMALHSSSSSSSGLVGYHIAELVIGCQRLLSSVRVSSFKRCRRYALTNSTWSRQHTWTRLKEEIERQIV